MENTILIGVITRDQDKEKSKEYLDELEFLTTTAGGAVVKRFTQNLDTPNPKTFLGSGKIKEVLDFINVEKIRTVFFENELSFHTGGPKGMGGSHPVRKEDPWSICV